MKRVLDARNAEGGRGAVPAIVGAAGGPVAIEGGEALLMRDAAGLNTSAVPVIRSEADTGHSWRRAVHELTTARLAHSPEWLTVIRKVYGHDPLYLTAEDEEGGLGLLPAFIVRRPFFGTVVTSMPFLDAGGPCSSSSVIAHVLVEQLIGEARRIGASLVELRCSERLDLDAQPMEHKVNMTLPLPAKADCLWRQLDGSIRNQIRKAERSGLSIDVGGIEHLPAFYDAFAVRMRDLASPVHAPEFLRATLDAFGDRGRVVLARKGNTVVGGLIALAFKDTIAVPWATCLKEYFSLCPNMLLYWETLRRACAEGFARFDFGRSSRDSGTYRFKRQWGAQEEPLFWYRIPIGSRSRTVRPRLTGRADRVARLWRHLPLSVTRRLGPPIRKYLTQ